MKCLAIFALTLVAASSATTNIFETAQFGGGIFGPYFNQMSQQRQLCNEDTVAGVLNCKIDQLLTTTSGQLQTDCTAKTAIAKRMAEEIVQQMRQAKEIRIVQAIRELQMELQQLGGFRNEQRMMSMSMMMMDVQKGAIFEAVKQLEGKLKRMQKEQDERLQEEDEDDEKKMALEELKESMEIAIEARLTRKCLQMSDEKKTIFSTKIQKLVTQFAIRDIQRKLDIKRQTAQQLQQQRQFIEAEKQSIEVRLTLAEIKGDSQTVWQLRQMKNRLGRKEADLTMKQAGFSLTAVKLEQSLTEFEMELRRQIAIELVKEDSSSVAVPLTGDISKNILV